MASIYQRQVDGRWIVAWREDGRRRYRYFQPTRADGPPAEALQFKASLESSQAPRGADISLAALALAYLESRRPHRCTWLALRKYVAEYCEPFAEKPVDLLTKRDLEIMRERMRHLSPNTTNKAQAMVQAVCAWGVEQGLCANNPWAQFKKLRRRSFTWRGSYADLERVLAASVESGEEWFGWALSVAFNLALRFGREVFELRWAAFEWELSRVRIEQSKRGGIKVVEFDPAEPGFLDVARGRYAADVAVGCPWVVHRPGGRRVISYNKAWEKIRRAAGLEGTGIRPYDLTRHLAASTMLAREQDPAAVAEVTGHRDLATMLRYYTHRLPEAKRRAIRSLPPVSVPAAVPAADCCKMLHKKGVSEDR